MSNSVTGFNITAAFINKVLKNVTSKEFNPKKDIDVDLFEHTFNPLNSALKKGFGSAKIGDSNFDYIKTLQENIAVFSAFKAHRQQNDLLKHITDEKGQIRSFGEFRKAVTPILQNYNVNWLQTEYSTTILRSQTARTMRDAIQNKDIYPTLVWVKSTSVNPRKAHRSLYGMVFKVGDPFLKTNSPGSLYNCKCSLQPSTKKATGSAPKNVTKPNKGLDCDPATSGMIYSNTHPYLADNKKLQPVVDKWLDDYNTK